MQESNNDKRQLDGERLFYEAIHSHSQGDTKNAEKSYREAIRIGYSNYAAYSNLGVICKKSGRTDEAISLYNKAIELNPGEPSAYANLGNIYRESGEFDLALKYTLISLKLDPDNPIVQMNLGSIHRNLGNIEDALRFTRKSLELKPNNPDAYLNLGGIYKNVGDFDKALAFSLKSIELKPINPGAFHNIKSVINLIDINASNMEKVEKAYEFLLQRKDIAHSKLTNIFLHIYEPKIRKAAAANPIITEANEAFRELVNDWRFLQSLTLMIPPSKETEQFLTRLRKEILILAAHNGGVPAELNTLTEALATQCFLNEYVYTTSEEEEDLVDRIIKDCTNMQEAINQNLAIIACYKAIHTTGLNAEDINKYPKSNGYGEELVMTQFKEPLEENSIKRTDQRISNISDATSKLVQRMYEENPYPRYKYSDYTSIELAKPTFKSIELETTRKNQVYEEELKSQKAQPKILIAGCGTGNQIIDASRYKNAQITAIDLSSRSLAYAIRKTKEYGMKNVSFKRMDILNISQIEEIFDVIECSGVIHHMERPHVGLNALIQQLKPGGYIKLGLYSEIARRTVVEARAIIQSLGINDREDNIKSFRAQVLGGEIEELRDLPYFAKDFYSLSECRDLCFHVHERRYTTEGIEELLTSNRLEFCGFMIQEHVKRLYKEQYPDDSDMTSLSNWGRFEKRNPTTFRGMYQFWSKKKYPE